MPTPDRRPVIFNSNEPPHPERIWSLRNVDTAGAVPHPHAVPQYAATRRLHCPECGNRYRIDATSEGAFAHGTTFGCVCGKVLSCEESSMQGRPPMPTPSEAGWFWYTPSDGPRRPQPMQVVRDAQGELHIGAPTCGSPHPGRAGGTWGERIPSSPTIEAMRELAKAEPWAGEQHGWFCQHCYVVHHATLALADWKERHEHHKPTCPWLRAQEAPAPAQPPCAVCGDPATACTDGKPVCDDHLGARLIATFGRFKFDEFKCGPQRPEEAPDAPQG